MEKIAELTEIEKRNSKQTAKGNQYGWRLKSVFFMEKAFPKVLSLSVIVLIIILLAIFITLAVSSIPSIKQIGIHFLYGRDWNPVTDQYGGLPFLLGTLLTSLISLVISVPFAISVAIFLGEYYPKGIISNFIKNMIDLLASIPFCYLWFLGNFCVGADYA